MSKILAYEKKDTWIHELSGVTKLSFFLIWSIVSMLSYDTRVLAVMVVFSLGIFYMSKTQWRQVAAVFNMIMIFLVLNIIAVFIFSPYHGVEIYGSRTDLFHIIGPYTMTAEQLFYEGNMILKYFTIIPAALMFLVTTDPSEFAASLNKVGIHYNIGYAIAIALRYIPDVQGDFTKIKHAQEARGIEMSGKASLVSRIKNVAAIIFPLIFSSMGRIDTISNAMELRGFGKHKKRTWYYARPLKRNDYITIGVAVIFAVIALVITFQNGSRFYNPF